MCNYAKQLESEIGGLGHLKHKAYWFLYNPPVSYWYHHLDISLTVLS